MATTDQFVLIKGRFNAAEAKELLLRLLDNKLKYHALKNFGLLERTGEIDIFSVERIKELSASREKILLLLNEALEKGETVRIDSLIDITIER